MTHEIIKTDNYLLVVDDSEIKEGDYIGYPNLKEFVPVQYLGGDLTGCEKKIIAHLTLNNATFLEGVDVLPPLEDDVEKLAEQEAFNLYHELENASWFTPLKFGIKTGYNKAREKYKFTEEDMMKSYYQGHKSGLGSEDSLTFKNIIQSLSQPKIPTHFECVMELCEENCDNHWCKHNGCQNSLHGDTIRTTTNSRGQTQWLGKYIYA